MEANAATPDWFYGSLGNGMGYDVFSTLRDNAIDTLRDPILQPDELIQKMGWNNVSIGKPTDTNSYVRNLGLGARSLINGLMSGATLGFGDGNDIADGLGLPTPKTETERTLGGVNEGAIDALIAALTGGGVAKYAMSPVMRGVGRALASTPKADMAVGGGLGGLLGFLGGE